MINEATRQANEAIPRAEGTAKRINSQAEGYATERVNRALGESERFSSVLLEYGNVPTVTRTRLYLEALSGALPRIGSVIIVQDGQMSPLPLLNLRDANVRAPGPSEPSVFEAPAAGQETPRQDSIAERSR